MTNELRKTGMPGAYLTAARAAVQSADTCLRLSVLTGLCALAIAGQATAGCGGALAPKAKLPTVLRSPALPGSGNFLATVYRPGSEEHFVLTGDEGGWGGEPAIVGMWRFQLAGITGLPPGVPVGAVVDDGYAQWHSDGTEIQNSGVHAPNTSNFCLGVWKQVGPMTYQLNHFPLAWDPTAKNGTGSPENAVQLTETVHLTDGNHMDGTFTLKVYVWNSTSSLDVASATPVATVTGNVTATRVTINSTVPGS